MSSVNTTTSKRSFMQRTSCILRAWLRQPSQVATVCPSSSSLIEQLADRDCVHEAARVIELGPGAGGTTEALLAHMRPAARLLAIEKTDTFAEALHAIGDPRLRVEISDASNLLDLVVRNDFGKVDVLISGIPFSSLTTMVAKQIIQSIHEVLRTDGVFIAYQLKSDVKDVARPLFGPPTTEQIPMNLPPTRAFVWRKIENQAKDLSSQPVLNT